MPASEKSEVNVNGKMVSGDRNVLDTSQVLKYHCGLDPDMLSSMEKAAYNGKCSFHPKFCTGPGKIDTTKSNKFCMAAVYAGTYEGGWGFGGLQIR